MAGQKGTVFGVDKYKEPKLLDRKDTIANAIIDACFMVPGNLPSLPHVGVNIRQYFYKEEIVFYTKNHYIEPEALNIILKIQEKLKNY